MIFLSKKFKICFPITFKLEGGFSDHSNDPGGATKYGISLRFLKGLKDEDGDGFADGDINKDGFIDRKDILDLTIDETKALYFKYFWNHGYDEINNINLSLGIYDMAVNASPKQAHKILQRILNVKDDGFIGPKTVAAANTHIYEKLDLIYAEGRRDFYKGLASRKPKYHTFLKGWLNRVDSCYI